MQQSLSAVLSVLGDEPVSRALVQWLDQSGLELDEPDLVATGKSGGMLMSAFLRETRPGRTGGLRIIKLVPASAAAGAEPRNHRAALSGAVPGNEEFIARHLVELDDRTSKVDDYWVMIQFPAGDGTEEVGTLAGLGTDRRLPGLAEEIVRAVLGGWNPDPATGRGTHGRAEPVSAARFVEDMLGESSGRAERARAWLRQRVGPDGAGAWFSPGENAEPLPNPVALGEDSPLGGCQVKLAVRGRAHGDLHPGNILVPVGGKAAADDFWLVDLSWYGEDVLLARDPVHLLLCLIADAFLPHMSEAAREELLTALTGEDCVCEGLLIPQGLAETVTRLRKAMIDWGAVHRINAGWRQQWFLALQACALMVVVRPWYTEEDHWWFFRLAASACRAYLERMGVRPPRTAVPTVTVPAAGSAAPAVAPGRDAVAAPAPVPVALVPAPTGSPAAATATAPEAGTTETALPPPDPVFRRVTSVQAAQPGAVEVLAEIWDVFDPALRNLSSASVGQVPSHLLDHIIRRATDFRLAFGHPRLAMPQPAGSSDEECREKVLGRLSDVADRAQELRNVLAPPLRRMQELAHGNRHPGLRALTDALGALLDEVRRADAALSAARPA
ncbi:hypothetical protein IGX29_08145 [Streptomyces sp. H28]|uniref:hypothetical protein n=1 Tax=Streptomyces sp. H28 TaxID=2775865 RepID=UPI001784D3D2|nr:hypothetical protein [Streptomyces sp. H28]MBD9731791.1 hypothetical protein [Streptomyces sp. H28]